MLQWTLHSVSNWSADVMFINFTSEIRTSFFLQLQHWQQWNNQLFELCVKCTLKCELILFLSKNKCLRRKHSQSWWKPHKWVLTPHKYGLLFSAGCTERASTQKRPPSNTVEFIFHSLNFLHQIPMCSHAVIWMGQLWGLQKQIPLHELRTSVTDSVEEKTHFDVDLCKQQVAG